MLHAVPPTIRGNDDVERRWVAPGNNISLTCDAEAIPVPSIQWLVNGEPLSPSARVRPQSGGRTLFISNAKVGNGLCGFGYKYVFAFSAI